MITNCEFSNPLVTLKDGESSYFLIPPNNTNQNFQFSKMTCDIPIATTTQGQATNTPQVYNGMTTGEIINSFWLFGIFLVLIFGLFYQMFIKKDYSDC